MGTSTFKAWLLEQVKKNSIIGDLASDLARTERVVPLECHMRLKGDSYRDLKDHLMNNSACSEAFQALEEAYEEFKKEEYEHELISRSLKKKSVNTS